MTQKKSSENDQLTGHFQSFFIYFFFVPSTLNLKNNSRKSTNKKILALPWMLIRNTKQRILDEVILQLSYLNKSHVPVTRSYIYSPVNGITFPIPNRGDTYIYISIDCNVHDPCFFFLI